MTVLIFTFYPAAATPPPPRDRIFPCQQIVLTKADLLTPELLSACVLLLQRDLSDLVGSDKSATVSFSAVCGSSGAGVTALWKALAKM